MGLENKLGKKQFDEPQLLMIDKEIIDISCGWHHSLILKRNGQLLGMGKNNLSQIRHQSDLVKPFLIVEEESLKRISSFVVWSLEVHQSFPFSFRANVLCFVLSLKRKQKLTNLKVPKYIIYEIIKLTT